MDPIKRNMTAEERTLLQHQKGVHVFAFHADKHGMELEEQFDPAETAEMSDDLIPHLEEIASEMTPVETKAATGKFVVNLDEHFFQVQIETVHV